jgi:ABC-2 type transport system permease protein
MQQISKILPLTHGIQAARDVAGGSTLGDVSGLVWTEALIGTAYAAIAYGLLRLFEFDGRRRASLETM